MTGLFQAKYHPYSFMLYGAIEKKDLPHAKYYVKVALINEQGRTINFHLYKQLCGPSNMVDELISYHDECLSEISRIKSVKFIGNTTLFDYIVWRNNDRVRPLYNRKTVMTLEEVMTSFPIYYDMIFSSLLLCEERVKMLNVFKELSLSSQDVGEDGQPREVHLPPECLLMIAEYLDNYDLEGFICAMKIINRS